MAIEAVFAGLATLFVEGIVLGGVLWPALLHALAPRLAVLERGFGRDFYLRQFDDEAQRQRVTRAPLLHYALLGWRTRRARAPGFDPAFYRRRNLKRPPGMDPLFHHLEKPHSLKSPRNEVEARTDRPPWGKAPRRCWCSTMGAAAAAAISSISMSGISRRWVAMSFVSERF